MAVVFAVFCVALPHDRTAPHSRNSAFLLSCDRIGGFDSALLLHPAKRTAMKKRRYGLNPVYTVVPGQVVGVFPEQFSLILNERQLRYL